MARICEQRKYLTKRKGVNNNFEEYQIIIGILFCLDKFIKKMRVRKNIYPKAVLTLYDDRFYDFKNKFATFTKPFWTLINRRTFTNKCIYSAYEWNNKSGDAF